MEIVLVEPDLKSWRYRIPLTEEWRDIRIPADSGVYCGDWPWVPPLKPGTRPDVRHLACMRLEFSAVAWAPGADQYLRDCISIFEEYGWDWTYHAFREWPGWSVEHEGPDAHHFVPTADTPRKRALVEGLRGR